MIFSLIAPPVPELPLASGPVSGVPMSVFVPLREGTTTRAALCPWGSFENEAVDFAFRMYMNGVGTMLVVYVVLVLVGRVYKK